MDMVTLLLIPICLLIGCVIGWMYKSHSVSKDYEFADRIKRRGIIDRTYTQGGESFDAQLEVGEVDRTDTKSKIIVIDMVIDRTKFSDNRTRGHIKTLINNMWMESKDIEWIIESKEVQRRKILTTLLNDDKK
jgi:hypothetical protein